MSSGSGPRARGTDGSDHKFRQRVESHYTIMSDSRQRLALVSKCHACHLAGTVILALPTVASMALDVRMAVDVAACLAAGLATAYAHAAGKSSGVSQAQRYSQLACVVAAVCLMASGYSAIASSTADQRSSLRLGLLAVHAFGVIVCGLGYRAATRLKTAFESAKGGPRGGARK